MCTPFLNKLNLLFPLLPKPLVPLSWRPLFILILDCWPDWKHCFSDGHSLVHHVYVKHLLWSGCGVCSHAAVCRLTGQTDIQATPMTTTTQAVPDTNEVCSYTVGCIHGGPHGENWWTVPWEQNHVKQDLRYHRGRMWVEMRVGVRCWSVHRDLRPLSVCLSLKEIDEQLLDSGNRTPEMPECLYTRRSLGTLNSSLPPSIFLTVTND